MRPVSPVLPDTDVDESTLTGKGHADLPVIMDDQGAATSRWLLTPEEVEIISRQGYLYVRQLGAVNGVQPIMLTAEPPIVVGGEEQGDPVLEADEIEI